MREETDIWTTLPVARLCVYGCVVLNYVFTRLLCIFVICFVFLP
uniref:Uncharacterized protein n=1 Tax=Anopheles quadriannulatus TaxID=34691 RepID=A0A182XRF9_ANOQN